VREKEKESTYKRKNTYKRHKEKQYINYCVVRTELWYFIV